MDLVKIADIPTDYEYTSRKNKAKALTLKILRAGLKIHKATIKGVEYNCFNMQDYEALKPYLEVKVSPPSMFNGRTYHDIAKELGLSSGNAIKLRLKLGWSIYEATSVLKGEFRNSYEEISQNIRKGRMRRIQKRKQKYTTNS